MPNWNRKLARVVETRDGQSFKTLKDAAEMVAEQREMNCWQSAAGKLLAAAEGGDIEAATKGVESALFLDGLRLRL